MKLASQLLFAVPSFLGIIVSFAPNSAQAQQIKDFFRVGDTQKVASYESTEGKGVFKDKSGKEWILKKHPLDLVVNEYVAGKVYEAVLGDRVGRSILVQDGANFRYGVEKLDGFYPISLGTLSFEGWSIYDLLTHKTTPMIHGKPVLGAELALLASLLVHEHDIDHGNNFSILSRGGEYVVGRYDFDDSLSFFNCFHITQIIAPERLMAKGYSREVLQQLLWHAYRPPLYADLSFFFHEPSFPAGLPRLKEAMLQIENLGIDYIEETIRSAFNEVIEIVGHDKLAEFYDRNAIRDTVQKFRFPIDIDGAIGDVIADFAVSIIRDRYEWMRVEFNPSRQSLLRRLSHYMPSKGTIMLASACVVGGILAWKAKGMFMSTKSTAHARRIRKIKHRQL